ncbi:MULTISPECIES: hypothetical protein [Cyanophyceae]|nr:hypothetical protein [Trichocoleus sp. FACHB-40]
MRDRSNLLLLLSDVRGYTHKSIKKHHLRLAIALARKTSFY